MVVTVTDRDQLCNRWCGSKFRMQLAPNYGCGIADAVSSGISAVAQGLCGMDCMRECILPLSDTPVPLCRLAPGDLI